MSPIFPVDQRKEIHTRLLAVGIELIREKGVKRTTIDEVTERVGIGKGTFYHFYPSKELYIYDVIRYSKESLLGAINALVDEKGGIDRQALTGLFRAFSFSGPNNIISSLTPEDELWLAERLPPEYTLDPPREEALVRLLQSYLIGAREEMNPRVVANILKIMALAVENRQLLHQDALEENLSLMLTQLCDYLFD